MSTADIEQDIYEEEERQKQLLEERKLKQAELKSLQAEFSKLLSTQAQLQEEQNELSKHIGEAYLMNSDLTLEVNSLKEQNQIKEIFDETPDTFDGDNDQIDFGLSPPRYSIDTNTSQRIVNEQVEKTSPKKQNANLNGSWLDLIPPGQSRNSSLSTGASYITQETSFLDEGTVDDFDHPPLNTVEIENVESVPHQEPLSESEDGNDTELPKELFRAPYRIKIPVRPPKK
ncbi:hypothetical protein TRFO_03341 [Tritrichomonas foetus]|uniref:Uncharacterized protein n=1 Tax=Tritrichomonas foetus TaxID=1144522 RepID=A0A1J4KQP8_9EUKA|nr:hypothetical protein TRFO_03341 [Tritrichomonas foetus]|eukprot:OHT13579.1 hypothetical protein TRFO_03341 [Tritrichomonas foetus]